MCLDSPTHTGFHLFARAFLAGVLKHSKGCCSVTDVLVIRGKIIARIGFQSKKGAFGPECGPARPADPGSPRRVAPAGQSPADGSGAGTMMELGVREAIWALVGVLSLYLVVILFRLALPRRPRRGEAAPQTEVVAAPPAAATVETMPAPPEIPSPK
jgi:hypothetical protein